MATMKNLITILDSGTALCGRDMSAFIGLPSTWK